MKNVIILLLFLNVGIYSQWKAVQTSFNSTLYSVQFFDTSNGIIAGANGLLLQSNNGGKTWASNNNFLNSYPDFYSISIYNNSFGWICGRSGLLMKTTDKGTTWIQKESPGPYYFTQVIFLNDTVGWLCGETNILFRTKYGEGYWTNEYITKSSNAFGYLYTKDGNIGYVVGDSGKALKTVDHGYSWTQINTKVIAKLENVTFSNDSLGCIVGDRGTILRTTDGGNSWSLDTTFSEYHFNWVTFVSSSVGWIVGSKGSILKTTDAGVTWSLVPSGTTATLRMVSFKDINHGYIVGDSAKILLYDTNSVTTNSENQNNNKAGKFEVYQNYPNPFNPATIIRFEIPSSSNVKIEVYNVLGEKIKELFNGYKNAGQYEVSFNTTGLASGEYFYIIEAKSIDGKSVYKNTKKMILLK